MGFFSKENKDFSCENKTTIISRGTSTKGEIKVEHDLRVDGYCEGTLSIGGNLTISKTGRCKGIIYSNAVHNDGHVDGYIEAQLVDIMSNGFFKGEIKCSNLVISEGARFSGEVKDINVKEVDVKKSQPKPISMKIDKEKVSSSNDSHSERIIQNDKGRDQNFGSKSRT